MPLILPFGGKLPQIAPDAFVADNAVIIGDVVIGSGASIWFGCVLRGDTNYIRVGARTNVQDGTVVHVAREGRGTEIGDDVMIGHMAMIHACTIQSGAMIGMTACVMDNSVVETDAMVAAGALISPNKTVKTGEVWAGRPGKFWRVMNDQDRHYFRSGVEHYFELGREYRTGEPHSRLG
ncbi:MAG: gamma carbonic anhydrase family protein [Rhodospirillales bacterium]|nr:gamma carbonic anhydrase family protein [Rhodospirillales bacterium]